MSIFNPTSFAPEVDDSQRDALLKIAGLLFHSLDGTSPLKVALTGGAAALAPLGANGEVWVGAFMNTYGGDMVIGFTRDLVGWTFIDDGAVVYVPPEGTGSGRDFELVYDPAGDIFYVFYTLIVGGTDASRFGVASSTDLVNWTHIQNIPIGSNRTIFSPGAYVDGSGELHIFAAAAPEVLGPTLSFTLYELHPVASWDVAGNWSAPANLTLPASQTVWNEPKVFRDPSDNIRMLVNRIDTNALMVLRPSNPAVLGGAWVEFHPGIGAANEEGFFAINLPSGEIRVYTTVPDENYSYRDCSADFNTRTEFTPCPQFPDVDMQNGAPCRLTGPRAALLGAMAAYGSLAEQNSDDVAITGGTIALSKQFKAKGYDDGTKALTGFGWYQADGTYISSIVPFANGEFLWFLPPLGLEFVHTAGTLLGTITQSGDLQFPTVTIGGFNGATGVKITKIRHGTATLSGGAVTITDANVVNTGTPATSSRIDVTVQALGTVTTPKAVAVTAKTNATSFVITSADATDTSVVSWVMINP